MHKITKLYRTFGLALAVALLVACATNGVAKIPNTTQANLAANKVQFTVGTARIGQDGVVGVNFVATLRQPNGLTGVLASSPKITGPAGFVVPAGATGAYATAGADLDAGTNHVSSSPQVPLNNSGLVNTTFGTFTGVYAYGLGPFNSDQSTVNGGYYPGQPQLYVREWILLVELQWHVDGRSRDPWRRCDPAAAVLFGGSDGVYHGSARRAVLQRWNIPSELCRILTRLYAGGNPAGCWIVHDERACQQRKMRLRSPTRRPRRSPRRPPWGWWRRRRSSVTEPAVGVARWLFQPVSRRQWSTSSMQMLACSTPLGRSAASARSHMHCLTISAGASAADAKTVLVRPLQSLPGTPTSSRPSDTTIRHSKPALQVTGSKRQRLLERAGKRISQCRQWCKEPISRSHCFATKGCNLDLPLLWLVRGNSTTSN